MKWAMLAVVLIVGGYFAWSYLSPGGQKQKATAEFHDAYKIDGGKTVKLSDREAKAQMPPAIADLLTSQTKSGTYNVNGPNGHGVVVIGGKGPGNGTGKFVGGGSSGAWDPSKGEPANLPSGLQGIGQAKSNIDDLVKSGMPLDQAIKSVEKGLDESMNAMNAAQGGGKTHTHIEYDGEKFSISSQTSPPDGK